MIVIDENSLVERLKQRDESTYKELFQSYVKLLWTIAGSILSERGGSVQDVEECVSDVFIELWNNPEKFDSTRGSLKSYLCGITKNKAIDRYRKNSKENVVRLEDYMEKAIDDDPLDIPDYSKLYEELKRIPEPTREILIRRYFCDEKPARIAERLGLSKKEVENRLYRGKKSLAESLSEYKEVE